MPVISLNNIRQSEGHNEYLLPLKQSIESRINLENGNNPISLSGNMVQRIALLAGLSQTYERNLEEVNKIVLSKSSNRLHETVFARLNMTTLISALLKLRYQSSDIDWEDTPLKSKIINYEMRTGADFLLKDSKFEEWMLSQASGLGGSYGTIPELKLQIGAYEGDIPAVLDLNGRSIPNTQILIAGTTGSGKSNLLVVLLHEIRSRSIETSYPVNFLLFDYKGEFSDPANRHWLSLFETDDRCLLDPMQRPLPFTPFKDFRGKTQNEINLYATEMANALCSIDKASISANMSNRLAEAVIAAYNFSKGAPITFQLMLDEYTALQPAKEQEKDDSIKSVLKQLLRTPLFDTQDSADLIKSSFVIKMDAFPKDGPLAKAMVYFVISKLNLLYEQLPKQAVDDKSVELRHFTIIDEAHYMLDFDNKPLRNLIAVGRNKGLSIILATQNMDSYRSKYFDFYANAQYPLIMKQQSIANDVIKDIFGVNGAEFQEVKEAIAGLQLGEVILRNPNAAVLGIGKKYSKVKVSYLG